ncbi:MAG: hypothetical protein Q7K43_03880 [Candidatus Woesearchaeota archaeon]|nr:hypothetical protein [Candidatus Woesearchaeota archaeon]
MLGQEGVMHVGAHLGYFSGLSMLIPILSKAWETQVKPWIFAPGGFVIAVGLVILSVVILAWMVGSVSKLLKSLGWMMIIPGVLALVFAVSSSSQVYSWANQEITGFSVAQPTIEWFVDHAVPKASYLGGLYTLMGFSMLFVGKMLSKFADFI